MTSKIILSILLMGWHLHATAFYGWNWTPQSTGEYIVDGICILGLCILWGNREIQ